MREEQSEQIPRAALAFVVASLCVLAFFLFRTPAPPALGDYAEWTYHGVLLRDVLQGHADAAYTLKNYPVPNSMTTIGLGVLMLALPWKIACKVWVLVEVGLGLAAGVALQRASGRMQGWRLLVLPAAVLMGTTFWWGFTNFMFGVSFAMLLCALLLRGVRSGWLCGALLIVTFFCHMIPFGFAVLVLVLYAWQEQRWRLLGTVVPSLGLCVWYFIGRALHADADAKAGMVATVPYSSPAFAAFKVNSYLKCWGFVNPASNGADSILLRLMGAKVFVVLFVLNAVIALGVMGLLLVTAWRAITERRRQRFFWIAVVAFFVVSLVMPGAAAGISDPGGRMMQVAVWCGVCLVATRRRWCGVVLGVCAVVLLGADGYLIQAVAMRPPMVGSTGGPLPARMREFAHAYYDDRADYYGSIEAGRRDLKIYPTAMFLKKTP